MTEPPVSLAGRAPAWAFVAACCDACRSCAEHCEIPVWAVTEQGSGPPGLDACGRDPRCWSIAYATLVP
jgi:hypothetical protein